MGRGLFLLAFLVATPAHARVETGNWEFSIESPLRGNGKGPELRQHCVTPEEAGDPAKVLSQARDARCQFSNVRDSGSEYTFDVACTARIPVHGSGSVRYTPRALDGEIDLVGERQGLRLRTRSFVSGRRLGPCHN
jgi:hypothetical protein